MNDTKKPCILVTRPLAKARHFIEVLEQDGFEILHEPMLERHILDFKIPDTNPHTALIFTSAVAVHVFGFHSTFERHPVFVVGDDTALAAQELGYRNIQNARGDGETLARMIRDVLKDAPPMSRRLLHIRGADIAFDVAGALADHDIGVDSLIVYQMDLAKSLPEYVIDALKDHEIAGIPFFSKRTAEAFFDLVKTYDLLDAVRQTKILCISDSVLKYVHQYNIEHAYSAVTPDSEGIITLIHRHCTFDQNSEDKQIMSANTPNPNFDDTPIENAEDVIERFGGIRPMAKKMDVAVTTVQGWKKRNVIPANRKEQVYSSALENNIDLADLISELANDSAPSTPTEKQKTSVPEPTASEPTATGTEQDAREQTHPTETVSAKSANDDDSTVENLQGRGAYMPRKTMQERNAGSASKHPSGDLDKKLNTIEKRAIRKSTWINGGLLVAGLVGLTVVLFGGDKADLQRIDGLESEVTDIREDLSTIQEQQSFLSEMIPPDLDERINRIQEQAMEAQQKVNQAIATASVISNDVLGENGGTFSERATKLNDGVRDATGIDMSSYLGLEGLMQRVKTLETSQAGQQQLNQTMAELSAVLGSFEGTIAGFNMNDQLELAQENMPALQETFENVPSEDLKAAALLLGLTQFRKSLNRDRAAFNDDLKVLKILIGDSNPELTQSIDRLAPYSASGVLTPDGLSKEFKTLAGEAIVESIQGDDVSLQDKIKGRIGEVVQLERDGELVVGNDTQIAINKAEDHLAQGDIAGAVALIEQLDGPAAKVLSPWLSDAKATMGAQSLQGRIGQALNGGGLSALGLGGGSFIRDSAGSTNIYVPKSPIQNSVQKSIDKVMQKGGL